MQGIRDNLPPRLELNANVGVQSSYLFVGGVYVSVVTACSRSESICFSDLVAGRTGLPSQMYGNQPTV